MKVSPIGITVRPLGGECRPSLQQPRDPGEDPRAAVFLKVVEFVIWGVKFGGLRYALIENVTVAVTTFG